MCGSTASRNWRAGSAGCGAAAGSRLNASRGRKNGLRSLTFVPSARFHDDLAGHVRMQATEVAVLAGLGEGEGELLVGVEHLRAEGLIVRHDVVGDVVLVHPGDGGPDGDGDRRRAEDEVV